MVVVGRPIAFPDFLDDIRSAHFVDRQNVRGDIWYRVINHQLNYIVLLRSLGSFLERKIFDPFERVLTPRLRVEERRSTVQGA